MVSLALEYYYNPNLRYRQFQLHRPRRPSLAGQRNCSWRMYASLAGSSAIGFAVSGQLQRGPPIIMRRTHCSVQPVRITSANEADLLATREAFAVHSALRTPARSCTDCSEICTEEPSPAAWGTVVGVVVLGTSSGCRLCTALVVCERGQGEGGYAAREKKSLYQTQTYMQHAKHRKQQSGGRTNSHFTYSCTPVAIFCIERVPRLDGLLVRNALPSLFARLARVGVPSGEPFLRHRHRYRYRRQCSGGCCRLFIGAFFRGGLGH